MSVATRGDVISAMNVLVKRRSNTADAAEQAVLDEAINVLAGNVQDLNQAALIDSVRILAKAMDELDKVIASARMAPFDKYLVDISAVHDKLQNTVNALHALDRLPASTQVGAVAAPVAPAEAGAPVPAAQWVPINSSAFADLEGEYAAFFERCVVRPAYQKNLDYYVARLKKFQPIYADVAARLGGTIPWQFIGVIHAMEAGFNFTTHLHNGDPLSARTVHVPKNRPTEGTAPFTWRDSAVDALVLKGFDTEKTWSMPHMLYLLEKYNGFGYRPKLTPTPYLWSFSSIYTSGKFVADHQFDPKGVSKQCGAGLILKTLQG